MGAHAPSLFRLLRTLSSVGVFTEVGERRFGLTPMGELLKTGPTLRAMILWVNDPRHDHAWEDFEHSVRTGQPCVEKAYGKPVFEWLPTEPDLAAIFNDAMSGNAANNHAKKNIALSSPPPDSASSASCRRTRPARSSKPSAYDPLSHLSAVESG